MAAAPCLEPLLNKVQEARACCAVVPPVELFVFTQLFVAPLKFSLIKVTAVEELDVADDVRFIDEPAQTEEADADAVTDVGTGFTTKVLLAATEPQEPPEVVSVNVIVPV